MRHILEQEEDFGEQMKVRYNIQSGGRIISIEHNTEEINCWLTIDEANPETRAYSLTREEALDIYYALGHIFEVGKEVKDATM